MNKVMLIGRLGKDPEMTYTPGGAAVTKVSLATSRKWTDKTTGERKEETTWFNLVFWEKLAELASQYLKKGSKVFVEGRFVSRKYTDKDGVERTAFDVVVAEMEMLDSKPTDASAAVPAHAATVNAEDFPF